MENLTGTNCRVHQNQETLTQVLNTTEFIGRHVPATDIAQLYTNGCMCQITMNDNVPVNNFPCLPFGKSSDDSALRTTHGQNFLQHLFETANLHTFAN